MNQYLADVLDQINEQKTPSTTVRTFLTWFDAYRRRAGVVDRIRSELEEFDLKTVPDFESAWIDGYIHFERNTAQPEVNATATVTEAAGIEGDVAAVELPLSLAEEARREAGFKVSKLTAANRVVLSINPDASILEATTRMLANDYSQLPVMTNERTLLGAVSWKSLGLRASQNNTIATVRDAMDAASVILDTDTIFDATRAIIKNDFTLVRSTHDNKIIGIITATDLSEQFERLSEPFLLLSEIENHIRNLINGQFTIEELKSACTEGDSQRRERVKYASDLTFGEYIRLLEIPSNWDKIKFKGDRKVFCAALDEVRQIRNDVMHFDPDGIDEQQEDRLRKFSRFMNEIDRIVQH